MSLTKVDTQVWLHASEVITLQFHNAGASRTEPRSSGASGSEQALIAPRLWDQALSSFKLFGC